MAVNLSDAFSWSEKQQLDGQESPDAGDVLEMRKAPERPKADNEAELPADAPAPAASEDLTQAVSAAAAAQDTEEDSIQQEGNASETQQTGGS